VAALPLLSTCTQLANFRGTQVTFACRRGAVESVVGVEEQLPLADFPRIKCNVSRGTSERIYHLPFDQQYDKTVIEQDRGEFNAATVAEAVDQIRTALGSVPS
jgi:hypothetical protein